MSKEPKKKPIHKFRNGNIEFSIWRNQKDDNEYYTCSLQVSWKDKKDEWHNQEISCFHEDLPKIILGCQQSYAYIFSKKNMG